ncbi:uncharacterized protein NPIL_138801 [Nephila pilipes]|uniref:Uncharacterized protein n=1 Tax=Nephila pilipes TaxID=299642 RepID=A0A8X6QMD4_NEPPI|nr:uncharacterized protein NPIL_138801 [Nephila pilipes]
MYQTAQDLFKEFQFITLKLSSDSRVKLQVPSQTSVTFEEKLRDMLGFTQDTFEHGDYKAEYVLELRAGITEIYVYCDIVAPSLVLDSLASILKIIPIANEHNEQIVKNSFVPLYFRVKKQFFDSVELILKTSSGSLRRYALPLMMHAGTYLGKRLLASGQNIIEDVSQGKSFGHAKRDQIRHTGREIKADIIRKLKGGGRQLKRKKSQTSPHTKRKKRKTTDVFSDI